MTRLRRVLTDRLSLSVVGLLAALVLCLVFLLTSVLEVPLTGRAERVTVGLDRSGGLFEGSSVTYRGVRVGTVESVGLDEAGRPEAVVSLRDGAEVPRDTRAAVRSLSPVGEQYLDLQPAAASGPYLADGDRIEASAVDLPVSLAEAVDGVDTLLGEIDARDVRVVLRELALAMDGSGDDLDLLLQSADEISTTLDDVYPETERLLENGETVGELFAAHRGDLRTLSSRARVLAAWLKDFDPEFRRILRRAPGDFDTAGVLVRDLQRLLPPLLRELLGVGELMWQRDPHLHELAQVLGTGAGRFADAFHDGWLDVDILFQGQEKCQYGGPRRLPHELGKEFHRTGRCGPGSQAWRGAQHAPPPLRRTDR